MEKEIETEQKPKKKRKKLTKAQQVRKSRRMKPYVAK